MNAGLNTHEERMGGVRTTHQRFWWKRVCFWTSCKWNEIEKGKEEEEEKNKQNESIRFEEWEPREQLRPSTAANTHDTHTRVIQRESAHDHGSENMGLSMIGVANRTRNVGEGNLLPFHFLLKKNKIRV